MKYNQQELFGKIIILAVKYITLLVCNIFHICLHFVFSAPSRPPSDVSVERKTSRSFVIIWSHPERNSINGILRNFVINLTDVKRAKSKLITIDWKYNSYNVSKLLPYRNYTVAVAVVNSIARGPFSQAIAAQTEEEGISFLALLNFV